MEWEFFNIFKKAEFNTLMLSIAITGWILHFFIFTNILVLGSAILSTSYCFIRFTVFAYHIISNIFEDMRRKEQNEKDKKEKETNREVEISRMFMGLSEDKKKRLAYILLKGKKDEYNSHMLHFQKNNQDPNTLTIAQATTNIFRSAYNEGVHTIELKYFTDTIALDIEPFLFVLIKNYIDDNGLKLKEDNQKN